MAELLHIICFRANTSMKEWLEELAKKYHRKRGDVVRLLLEQVKENNPEDHG